MPLAYELSPKTLDDYVGQDHLLGKQKPLRVMIENDRLISMILWGPPGCGKTSLSRLISNHTKSTYFSLNAVTAKIGDIKDIIEKARAIQIVGKRSILFIDEIHRFNKVQQDALLPDVESGLVTLIGATTENPFFTVIPGLVSRCQIFELQPLPFESLIKLSAKAIQRLSLNLSSKALSFVLNRSDGDARKCLNNLELIATTIKKESPIEISDIESLFKTQGQGFSDDNHYDMISAFIKSMRGSDVDAAIYWLARLLHQGEDPLFITRRLIIFASEDVGNADPHALPLATSLLQAVKHIGMPEVRINLSQVTAYMSLAPKSNASYMAIKAAENAIKNGELVEVPHHLKDSHYKGAKTMGRGSGYKYPHDYPDAIVPQLYYPGSETFYNPKNSGYEALQLKEKSKISYKIDKFNKFV